MQGSSTTLSRKHIMDGMNTESPGTSEPDEMEPIFLRRFPKLTTGDCVGCGKLDASPEKALRLSIEFRECYIALCPKHEGELLEALLKNYVRRRQKKGKAGFCGPLNKPTEQELKEAEEEEDDDEYFDFD